MPHNYRHILAYVIDQPWAMHESTLKAMIEVLQLRLEGQAFTQEEIQARIGAPPEKRRATGEVAVLPITGVIAHRMNLMSDISGGTSTEQLAQAFRELVADPEVGGIVLDINSPGGGVFGLDELATEIFEARGKKPIVAVANAQAASAAYYLFAQADERVVTPSGEVGSIGVRTMHRDLSKAEAQLGIKTTVISAGKFKSEIHPSMPLSDEAHQHLLVRAEEYYDQFVKAVARGIGVPVDDVRNGFGEGRMVGARQAVKLGMADKVATLEQTIRSVAWRVRQGAGASPAVRAQEPDPALTTAQELETRATAQASIARSRSRVQTALRIYGGF